MTFKQSATMKEIVSSLFCLLWFVAVTQGRVISQYDEGDMTKWYQGSARGTDEFPSQASNTKVLEFALAYRASKKNSKKDDGTKYVILPLTYKKDSAGKKEGKKFVVVKVRGTKGPNPVRRKEKKINTGNIIGLWGKR